MAKNNKNKKELTPAEHVGSRIRLYRKQRGITLRDFAGILHRSPSALSKYENGIVPVDVSALFEIATALGVTVSQLTDYVDPKPITPVKRYGRKFFSNAQTLFMYTMPAFDKKIWKCIVEIISEEDSDRDKVVMYYGIDDPNDIEHCRFVYAGTIAYSDYYVFIQAESPYSHLDNVCIYVRVPFQNASKSTGIITTIADSIRNPYAAKVLFSETPLPMNEALKRELMINDKASIKDIRRNNAMAINYPLNYLEY